MTFEFSHVSISDVNGPGVEDVSGSVKKGDILGVFGDEGCGKTNLLLALTGREPFQEGEITLNDQQLESKHSTLSSKVAFVPAKSFFLPTLTINETLKYATDLFLSGDVETGDRAMVLSTVIRITNLQGMSTKMVQFTPMFTQKCLGLACQLLRDTDVIVMEEPFTGLSHGEVISMATILSNVAKEMNRAVVISVAMPLNHVVNMCSSVLLLHHGQIVYSGVPDNIRGFLSDGGFICHQNTSPIEKIMELMYMRGDSMTKPFWISTHSSTLYENAVWQKNNDDNCCNTEHQIANGDIETGQTVELVAMLPEGKHGGPKQNGGVFKQKMMSPSQMTSYIHQLRTLTARNFHNARRRFLFPIGILQNVYITVLCVMLWWRPERTEEGIKDRMGLFFFTTVQWAFFALFDSVIIIPKEKKAFVQERSNHMYSTSAYCLSKILSELPLSIIQPSVYMCVIYWVANLNSASAFCASLGVVMLDVIAAQGIGMLLGVALTPPWTIMALSLGLLSMMLIGGAFCTPRPWLQWGTYASFFTYAGNAFIKLEFTNADPIRCGVHSMMPMCQMTVNETLNGTQKYFPSEVVLELLNTDMTVADDVIVLVLVAVVTRIMWYILLRRK